MAGVTLSILICHVPERERELARLRANIDPALTHAVEVLVDDKDSLSIGAKRNRLLAAAAGRYVAFVDDDDIVAPSYVPSILDACARGPDVVGMRGVILFRLNCPRYFVHTLQVDHWYTNLGDHTYYRTPNHLNPTRREIVVDELGGFNDRKSFGEDIEYSRKIRPLLRTEQYVDDVLYYYLYSKTTATRADGREDRA